MRAFISLIVLVLITLNSVFAAKRRIAKYQHQQPYYQHQQPYNYQPYYQNEQPGTSEEEHQDLSKLPGEAGKDYPLYHAVPETSFSCASVPFVPGIYANVESGCQAYHVCHDGREGHQGASFLCSNGTLFSQKDFTCDYWYNVDCRAAPEYYRLNGDVETNPFAPKSKSGEDKSSEQYSSPPLPGLKYYKPHAQNDYLYKQPYQQRYQQPYHEQPYKQPQYTSKPLYQPPTYRQPQQYQQYEQQEYQEQPYQQQNQGSYEDSQEKQYHPTRFYK